MNDGSFSFGEWGYDPRMVPKNNRRVTVEEMLEQCRRNRQQARILEKRDQPYEIKPQAVPAKNSVPVSTLR